MNPQLVFLTRAIISSTACTLSCVCRDATTHQAPKPRPTCAEKHVCLLCPYLTTQSPGMGGEYRQRSQTHCRTQKNFKKIQSVLSLICAHASICNLPHGSRPYDPLACRVRQLPKETARVRGACVPCTLCFGHSGVGHFVAPIHAHMYLSCCILISKHGKCKRGRQNRG